jgi:hypothetical protein
VVVVAADVATVEREAGVVVLTFFSSCCSSFFATMLVGEWPLLSFGEEVGCVAGAADDEEEEEEEERLSLLLLLLLSSLLELGDNGSSFILCHQTIHLFNFSNMKEFRLLPNYQ